MTVLTKLSSHLCECRSSCGRFTAYAVKTDSRRGHRKGEPMRLIPGHNAGSNVGLAAPEFDALSIMRMRALPNQEAADALDGRLRVLERGYRRSFVERGLILVEMEERQLWKLLRDSETNQPYSSLEDWICTVATYSRSDCMAAKEAVKKLKDVPTDQLLDVPRCNIGSLLMLSAKDRAKGAVKVGDKAVSVIEAAQSLPEKAFTKAVSERFPDLYIQARKTIHLEPQKTEAEDIEEAIKIAMVVEGCSTRTEALRAISISYIQDNLVEYERMTNGRMERSGA